MATNSTVPINPPSLKSRSGQLDLLFLATLITETIFVMPINYVFFISSFDMAFYMFSNTTVMFRELSILFSNVPMIFTIYGNTFHPGKIAFLASRTILLFFSLPFLYFSLRWLYNIFIRSAKRIHEYRRGINIEDTFSQAFIQRLSEVARAHRFAVPKIRTLNLKGVLIYTRMNILAPRATIIISKKILERLNEKELEAITAHEVGHIKQGMRKIELLKLFSRIALFPNFLLTVLLNSREMEISADKFAMELCEDKGDLKSALIKLSAMSTVSKARLFEGDKLPRIRLSKRMINWRNKFIVLDNFFFGKTLIGYSHPEIKERLLEIEKA